MLDVNIFWFIKALSDNLSQIEVETDFKFAIVKY